MSHVLIILFVEHLLYFWLCAWRYENISTLLHNSLRFYRRGKSGLGTGVKRFAQDHTAGQWRVVLESRSK